jgi:hypothetical protein
VETDTLPKDNLLARVLQTNKEAVQKEEEKTKKSEAVAKFDAILQAYDDMKAREAATSKTQQGQDGNVAARTAELAAKLDSAKASQPAK